MLRFRFWPTCRSTVASYWATPGACTVTLCPVSGSKAGAEKTPEPLVSSVRTTPREALEMTTLALGTEDPEGSLTSPESPAPPPADCAKHDAAPSKKNVAAKLNI